MPRPQNSEKRGVWLSDDRVHYGHCRGPQCGGGGGRRSRPDVSVKAIGAQPALAALKLHIPGYRGGNHGRAGVIILRSLASHEVTAKSLSR